jgi:fatty-acyl-CoA synthase
MQSYALTVDKFLDHAAKWSPAAEIVWSEGGIAQGRVGYAMLRNRSNRLSGAFRALGLVLGDRVATLAWNTQHHLETYYATMSSGLVCHTLNPRFTVAHLAAIINEAGDRLLAVASGLVPMLRELAPLCPTLEHVVLLDGGVGKLPFLEGSKAKLWAHDSLLETHGAPAAWGDFDERTPAGLCYTSGTTGAPKGVLYSHRSNYLHTLRALQADAIALTGKDVVLIGVPMFHANGWGLPFAAPAAGAKIVLPGRQADGASLARLMRDERVTLAVGVHTLWLGVVDHVEASGLELPDLERVLIGGSRCPESVLRRIEERLGVQVQTSWGMTELSPMGTISPPGGRWSEEQASGRPPLGLDLKLTDAKGTELMPQRGAVGHLKVKGASVLARYYNAAADALDEEGYFDTGDLASLDAAGNLTICGRSKDLIKSGGEWINPAEIEDIVGRLPAVRLVAVVGRSDPRWGERPVLVVELHPGESCDSDMLLGCLKGKVASWWIPESVVQMESMPLAATGKIDKNHLRAIMEISGSPLSCTGN